MAGPQMLASVIGASPYARMIRYQYTAVDGRADRDAAIEGPAGCGATGSSHSC